MIRLLLVCLMVWGQLGAIAPKAGGTLSELDGEKRGSYFGRAVSFLHKSHPELGKYEVTSAKTDLDRGDQAYADNLIDFHFQLTLLPRKVLSIVTLSTDSSQEFVSISPFVLSLPQAQNQNNLGNYWISEALPMKDIMNNGGTSENTEQPLPFFQLTDLPSVPGSYKEVPSSDRLVQFALDFVAGEHPNMVNYRMVRSFRQVVSGVNIWLDYVGLDKYSTVTAVVHFNSKNSKDVPKGVSFRVGCIEASKQFCNKEVAWDYFFSLELIVVSHPQLLGFRVVEVDVKPKKEPVLVNVVATFEHKLKQLRTLVDMDVDSSKSKVQSFFTYSQ